MKICYLDEPLNEEELGNIKEFLTEREGYKYTEVIDQIRIPTVLPTPDIDGYYKDDVRKLIDLVKKNLLKTGLLRDSVQQIIFVLGKDNFWNGIFQLAIFEVTGFYPYIAQRWYYNGDHCIKRDLRLIDGHGIMGYKD